MIPLITSQGLSAYCRLALDSTHFQVNSILLGLPVILVLKHSNFDATKGTAKLIGKIHKDLNKRKGIKKFYHTWHFSLLALFHCDVCLQSDGWNSVVRACRWLGIALHQVSSETFWFANHVWRIKAHLRFREWGWNGEATPKQPMIVWFDGKHKQQPQPASGQTAHLYLQPSTP